MEFKISTADFANGLNKVKDAIATRDLVPALKYLYMEAGQGDLITLRASDTELSIETVFYAAQVKAPGAVCVPGKQFIGLTSLIPSGDIHFKKVGEKLQVKAGTLNTKVAFLPGEQFPTFPEGLETACDLDGEFLARLQRVAVSMNSDPVRLSMRGVLFSSNKKFASLTATNSININHCNDLPSYGVFSCYMPFRFVEQILRLKPMDFGLYTGENEVGADLELEGTHTRVFHRKLGVEFVNFKPVLDAYEKTEPMASFGIGLDDFKGICERGFFVAPGAEVTSQLVGTSKAIEVELRPGEDAAVHSCSDLLDLRETFHAVPSSDFSKPIKLVASPSYFLEFLNVAGIHDEGGTEDRFFLDFFGPNKAIRLRDREGWFVLLNPHAVTVEDNA